MKIVVKVGGSVCLDPAQVETVAAELKALRAAGHSVLLVHGGGPQLDQALATLGEPVVKIDGLRVTSKAAADVVRQVMDDIGADIARQLNAAGVPAGQLASSTRAFQASMKRLDKGDLGRVGTVKRFTGAQMLADDGTRVAIVTPVGFDAQGPLNINADEGASAVASALQVDWLILATDVEAVRGATGEPLSRMTPRQARQLIAANTATGGMIPKLTSAVSALASGVGHVLVTKVQPGVLSDAIIHGNPRGTLVEDDLEVLS